MIRLSGPQALNIGQSITGKSLTHRDCGFARFKDQQNQLLDSGLVLAFHGPHSFTGEDVVELHGHGGPVILDMLMAELISLGARQARAGEFSERAYLNDKIDLAQAEAIADLIDSSTRAAARGAVKSLHGEFSNKVNTLLLELIELRVYVEAAIDFPEEEIDFLADDNIRGRIGEVQSRLDETIKQAGQGAILRNGLTVVLAGKPNAGKSSLLNALAGEQRAIVTDVPGTTRDTIRQTISIDGLPLHIIDTAGLRSTEDQVEKIGVQLAHEAMEAADHILMLVDGAQPFELDEESLHHDKTSLVINKIDLCDEAKAKHLQQHAHLISAKTGEGLDDLRVYLKELAGFSNDTENVFTARRRHLEALQHASSAVQRGMQQLEQSRAGELLAEELRQAQESLGEITGEFSADDLLGEIFSGFCIGK